MPPDIPVTVPVLLPTVAIAVLLLLHEPSVVASDNVVDVPWQNELVPVTEATEGVDITVTKKLVVDVPQEFVTL